MESICKIIAGSEKLLILLDDAHLSTIASDLIGELQNSKYIGKVKLVITTRTPLFQNINDNLPIRKRISHDIKLSYLNDRDSLQLFSKLVQSLKLDYKHLNWLSEQSGGVPGVIRLISFVLNKSGDISEIFSRKSLRFSEIVNDYINEIVNTMAKELELTKVQVKKGIWLAACLTPFQLYDNGRVFTEFMGISIEQLKNYFRQLVENDLIRIDHLSNDFYIKMYEQDPKIIDLTGKTVTKRGFYYEVKDIGYLLYPDPYRDIIVNWFSHEDDYIDKLFNIDGYGSYMKSIISNLFNANEVNPKMRKLH